MKKRSCNEVIQIAYVRSLCTVSWWRKKRHSRKRSRETGTGGFGLFLPVFINGGNGRLVLIGLRSTGLRVYLSNGVTQYAPTQTKHFFLFCNNLLSLQAECSRYFGSDLLRPVAYAGSVKRRRRLAEQLGLAGDIANDSNNGIDCRGPPGSAGAAPDDGNGRGDAASAEEAENANVVITSYNILRTDSDVLGEQVGNVFEVKGRLGSLVRSCFGAWRGSGLGKTRAEQ